MFLPMRPAMARGPSVHGAGCGNGAPEVPAQRRAGGYRRPPSGLTLAAVVAMTMSAMYLYRIFAYMPAAIESDDFVTVATTFLWMLLFFGMFIRFVICLFRLPSGSRSAWAGTVRMACSYILLTALGEFGVFSIMSTAVDFGMFTIPSWAMSVVMALLIAYMFTGGVRDFFTPTYAGKVPMLSWAGYVLWLDPFNGKRMKV